MKYNKAYDGEDFQKYQEYLSTIKASLSQDIFDFVSDPARHDFSKQSLHDSRLKKAECIRFLDTGQLTVALVLINADFDREFSFYFRDVSQYKIAQQISDMDSDLITFEVGLEQDANENKMLVFRAMFSGKDAMVEVYFKQLTIKEMPLK